MNLIHPSDLPQKVQEATLKNVMEWRAKPHYYMKVDGCNFWGCSLCGFSKDHGVHDVDYNSIKVYPTDLDAIASANVGDIYIVDGEAWEVKKGLDHCKIKKPERVGQWLVKAIENSKENGFED